jgi:hypothetical protein
MPPRGFEPRTIPPQGIIISSLTIGAYKKTKGFPNISHFL